MGDDGNGSVLAGDTVFWEARLAFAARGEARRYPGSQVCSRQTGGRRRAMVTPSWGGARCPWRVPWGGGASAPVKAVPLAAGEPSAAVSKHNFLPGCPERSVRAREGVDVFLGCRFADM